jgi:hypothetical protein
MSNREAAIFVINSDKDQTIKELILSEREEIITAIKLRRHVEDFEIEYDAQEYFEKIFLDHDIYYDIYIEDPFSIEKEFNVKKGQIIIAILSVNSAGYWERLQVLPTKIGVSNVLYYSEREQIPMPS